MQVSVLGVFLVLNIREQFQNTRQRDLIRLQKQTQTIGELLGEALSRNDPAALDYLVRSIRITTIIGGARLTDVAGNTLAVSSNRIEEKLSASERARIPMLLRSPGYHLVLNDAGNDEGVQPVTVGGTVRALAWVIPDSTVIRRLPNSILQNALIYGGFALAGNLVLVWLLSTSLARPLRSLRQATQQVQTDANDLSAFPLPMGPRNEVGELTNSFNAMVNEIASQRRGTQETLSLLDSLLLNAPIGFAFYDRQYRYVRINEYLATMHGVSIEDHAGKRLRDLLKPDSSTAAADEIERVVDQVFRTGDTLRDHEIVGQMPGDALNVRRTWLSNFFPVRTVSTDIRWVGVIVSEITERLRAEEAMRRSEKLAAAGRLAASIAHEINNPLESVTNLLYLLHEHPSLDEESKEYANMAQRELARVAEITQQTLRFYRQSTFPVDVRLAEVMRSILVLHQGRLQSARIELSSRMEDAELFAYAGELRQLFASLVGNAIDAMPQGGTLFLRVRSTKRRGVRGVRVTVADNGTGIEEAVKHHIFEPFFTTKEATGTGLGLWVSDEILHKHHGTVSVRSQQARNEGDSSGTVFAMFFPLDGVPRGPVIVRSAPAQVGIGALL